jgi:ATP-dependent DNA helicase PIF1
MLISTLSEEQKEVVYAIEDGLSVFVTGSAGTGKSYLLKYLKKNYAAFNFAITASTGISAVNIQGQTIYSWAGIGLGNMSFEQLKTLISSVKFSQIRKRIKTTKMLAIDEISMIPASVFNLIDQVFRFVRRNNEPFGGMQMVLLGDFLQLPPVDIANDKFCIFCESWKELNPKLVKLKNIFRQQDKNIIKTLENIRFGNINNEDINLLNSRINVDIDQSIIPTNLVSHNHQAKNINEYNLNKISEDSVYYEAKFSGNKSKFDFLKKNCLADVNLELKKGCQVMMLKNTYREDGVVNGSLGKVIRFTNKKLPIVEFHNGAVITIDFGEWAIEKYDNESEEMKAEAKMKQIPLLLSWAITIHKSQGMTLDKARCDLSKIFTCGQAYVALSRVRKIEDLYIDNINYNRILADPEIVKFYQNL